MNVKFTTKCEACGTAYLLSHYSKHLTVCPALYEPIRYNGGKCCLLCDAEDNELHFCAKEEIKRERCFQKKETVGGLR